MTEKERLIWYCQLTLQGYTSEEANQLIDNAIEKYKSDNKK